MAGGLMPGMGGQGAPAGMGGGAPMRDMPAEQGAPEEQPNVSPEEQAQYDQFMDQAFLAVYSKGAFEAAMKRIQATPDPVEGLAAVVVMTVIRVKSAAEQAGVQISPDVLYHGGADLLADLAKTAGEAGVHSFTPEDTEGAWYRALDLYRETEEQAGGLHQEGIKQDWQALTQADQAGQLDQMFPELGRFKRGQGAPERPATMQGGR